MRLLVGESVMTLLHWAEVRFLVPPLSKWSAISSDMKVFKSTSRSPFLLRLVLELPPTWVGEPGVLERTLILAIAPLRPWSAIASRNGCKSVSTEESVSEGEARLGDTTVSLGGARELRGGGILPHRKLIKSSLRIVRRRFFTQAKTSLLRR